MKNISLTVSPYLSYTPPAPQPLQGLPAQPAKSTNELYSVAISAQFEDNGEALAFAKFMLDAIETFKNGDR